MKMSAKFIAPWLAAAAITGAVALAPVAGAAPVSHSPATTGTDPLVPYGTNPDNPYPQGYVDSNHDEVYTTNGSVDLPF
ncbi:MULTISPECIES: hypothetical protein [Mycolicibacterium]|uniref:hypothetical protein n=1 Tax=Mycolicibacterium TaxID=1866885 RepID=UPI0009392BC4|nr:hypothetical protein [Mycolicibacterium mageritense]MBN3458324.1 hypothetical protein [Mycobacterium sp. DSM 3803]OKH75094.1 hypothetical protein EB73_04610 [Mycobacterium sp. SWH-M3]GJJ20055.1 hypothetical protein MTY414_37280 [Mycolicibacterium mageritense]